MLEPDHSQRITVQEILGHEWFTADATELPVGSIPGRNFTYGVEDTVVDVSIPGEVDADAMERIAASNDSIIAPKILVLKSALAACRLAALDRLVSFLKENCVKEALLVSVACPAFKRLLEAAGLQMFATEDIFDKSDIAGSSLSTVIAFYLLFFVFTLGTPGTEGMLDYRELTLFLRLSGVFSTEEIIKHFVFPLLDFDGSRVIDMHELERAFGSLLVGRDYVPSAIQGGVVEDMDRLGLIDSLFRCIDRDNDGIDRDDLMRFYEARNGAGLSNPHAIQAHNFLFRLLDSDDTYAASPAAAAHSDYQASEVDGTD